MKRYDNKLLIHNIKINGLKALIYCYGLGDTRYVEYSLVLDHLCRNFREGNDYMLDIGGGHSILPTFLAQNFGSTVVILDTNPEALKYQIQKSTKTININSKIFAVRGSATNLPFKDEAFAFISCISVLEHLSGNLDVLSSKEICRALRPKGGAVITVPGVGEENAIKESTSLYTGIPYIYIKLFGPILAEIFRKMGVDRQNSYYERRYTVKEAYKRLISTTGTKISPKVVVIKQNFLTRVINVLHRKAIPLATFTPFEFIAAKVLKTKEVALDTKEMSDMIGIEIKKEII